MDRTLNILCIEDVESDAALLELHLARNGVSAQCRRVDTAAGLADALEGTWDLVLSDYNVPGMEFLENLRLIQSRLPDLPVILVTGALGEETAVELLNHGAWDFILKDNLARLVPAMQRCLDLAAGRRARREAEAALQANEAKFRAYFEQAPILLLVFDAAGRCVDANPRALETLRYGLSSLTRLEFADLLVVEERDEAWVNFLAACARNHGETEYHLLRRDAGRLWVTLRGTRIGEDRYIAYATDITARKLAEEHLRLMAVVFNSTQEGIAITDLEGRVLAINAAFSRITEYPEVEVKGRRLNLLSSGRHQADYYQSMWWSLRYAGYWQGEIWNRRKSGDVYLQWLTISTVSNTAGAPEKYVGVFTDISRIRHATTHLEYLAHHDALTELPNRLLLNARLEHLLEQIRRQGGQGALLFLDLDHFKPINDRHGHLAGDDLLKKATERMQSRLRESDTLARFGGDEFVILMEHVESAEAPLTLAQEIVERLREPFRLDCGAIAEIGCSIGVCLFPRDGGNVSDLIARADAALYQAKQEGRGTVRLCQP